MDNIDKAWLKFLAALVSGSLGTRVIAPVLYQIDPALWWMVLIFTWIIISLLLSSALKSLKGEDVPKKS